MEELGEIVGDIQRRIRRMERYHCRENALIYGLLNRLFHLLKRLPAIPNSKVI